MKDNDWLLYNVALPVIALLVAVSASWGLAALGEPSSRWLWQSILGLQP